MRQSCLIHLVKNGLSFTSSCSLWHRGVYDYPQIGAWYRGSNLPDVGMEALESDLGRKAAYNSILVDLAEIRRLVHGVDPESLPLLELAKVAGFTPEVARALVRNGHVEGVVVSQGRRW